MKEKLKPTSFRLNQLQEPGIHILIDETLDAELANYFSFSGYPGNAFIDMTGNYKPCAINWISDIENRESLAALINKQPVIFRKQSLELRLILKVHKSLDPVPYFKSANYIKIRYKCRHLRVIIS